MKRAVEAEIRSCFGESAHRGWTDMSLTQDISRRSRVAQVMCAIVLMAWTQPTSAATIRVAQDGSGDYTSLFDGLAAAQDGDTVSIGPGEYSETRPVNPSGIEFDVVGYIATPNVSVVGDGRDVVFIGPAIGPSSVVDENTTGLGVGQGASGVSISGVTVRHLATGIRDADSALSVRACRLVSNGYGIDQMGLGTCVIEDSEFIGNRLAIIAFSVLGARRVEVLNSTFVDNREGLQIQNPDTLVRDCAISGGERGLVLGLGGNAILQDSVVSDTANRGVHVSDGSTAWLYNNVFQGAMQYNVFNSGALVGGGNLLSGGSVVSLYLAAPGVVEFYGNHLLNAGGLTVFAGVAAWKPRTISLANNWWGTTDPAQIEEWVDHAPDDPDNNGLTIEYLPFYGGPVPNEESSIGRLKGKFSTH